MQAVLGSNRKDMVDGRIALEGSQIMFCTSIREISLPSFKNVF